MKYEIPEEVLNGIINYLSSRPYAEVADGIKALLELKPIKEEAICQEDSEK